MERFEAHGSSYKEVSQRGSPPEANSTSGIYAHKTSRHALENLDRCWCRGIFLGKVKLWGVIQKHQFGYRAQFAYPLSLHLGICCVCKRIINLKSEPFAIGWATLYITESFSVSGFLCERCNERYYSVDTESSYRELIQLTERYCIKIE
ncbi:MAG: hypothetical protein QMC83_08175 [Thermodesulfovibrionales bacterium]|nr:hypothetical protein [Thermodesulfovibrionales bacterium]